MSVSNIILYTSAEEELHRFIENELPPEKSHEIDALVNAVTNAMFHAAILYGIKYGELLE